MREIKFRAWDINENKMKYENYFGSTADLLNWSYNYACEIMQFTGLKDKNGKEIFDGDIVKYNDALFIVEWDNDSGCFYLNKITQDNIIHDIRMNRLDIGAVIKGNKFENPELLEVQSR